MTEAETQASPGASLISEVLARRERRGDAGWVASVRRGIAPASEIAAFGATERHFAGITNEVSRTALRRSAAICASATGAPQTSKLRLGQSLARLDQKLGRGSIDSRVNTLPLLDLESAATALSGLVGRCSQNGIPVNFYDLAYVLARWGNGISPASRAVRARVLQDYYGAYEVPSNTDNKGETQ